MRRLAALAVLFLLTGCSATVEHAGSIGPLPSVRASIPGLPPASIPGLPVQVIPTPAYPVVGPAGTAVEAVSFVSPTLGYVLLAPTCAHGCAELFRRTADGGRSFSALRPPPGASVGLTFATETTGWSFTGPADTAKGLSVTRDGGQSWQPVPALASSRVVTLETTGGWAYALTETDESSSLWATPVATDDWRSVRMLDGYADDSSASLAVAGGVAWVATLSGGFPARTALIALRGGVIERLPQITACFRDGVRLAAASDQIVWAVCSDISGENDALSTDGGHTFQAQWPSGIRGIGAVAADPGNPGGLLILDGTSGLKRVRYNAGAQTQSTLVVPATGSDDADSLRPSFIDATHAVSYLGRDLLTSDDAGQTWVGHPV